MNDSWQKTSLDQCLSKVIDYRGKTPKKLGSTWVESGYRAISANNVKFTGLDKAETINFADESLYRKWMKEEVKSGDLLLTSEAPSGQVMLWDSEEKIVLSQRLYALRTNSKIYNRFLKYYLQSKNGQKEIKRNNSGSTVSGISAKTFANIMVRHPDYEEQKTIGDLLYLIDKKIEINNSINLLLETTVKSIYDFWFVQYEFPNGDGKPYKSSGGLMTYNFDIKSELPAEWKVCDLGDVVNFKRGISYKSSEIREAGVPLINLNSFSLKGKFKASGTKFFNGKFKSDSQLNPGELVIAITDVTQNADIIGKAFIIPDIFDTKPLISCDVAAVSSSLGVAYLEQLFNSSGYHEYIKHFASGTLVLHLDLNGVKWFKTIAPPRRILDKFEDQCSPLLTQRNIVLRENTQLENLREFLIPVLMSGQVKIVND